MRRPASWLNRRRYAARMGYSRCNCPQRRDQSWIGDHRFDGMLYNGAYILELWRVSPGDKLVVTLSNKLPEFTNLHFHGMKVSRKGRANNVFVHIQPGKSFTYR